ncbi:MAG: hypothetical protein AMDU4_FER2C00013G0027 [Ferroplasma sp. Type II]|nr:MAG: hypothetical protein AMDU4_FER2C00013G0027 [Ferroplasma sp. Type II]
MVLPRLRGNKTIDDNVAIAREKSYFKHGLKVKQKRVKMSLKDVTGINYGMSKL